VKIFNDLNEQHQELNRKFNQSIKIGVVTQVDVTKALAKVQFAQNLTTPLLPWLSTAASNANWRCLELGEQVVVISPCGDINQGIILPSIYSNDNPSPGSNKNELITKYADGTIIKYDTATGSLSVDSPQIISVTCSTATINANQTTINGNLSVNGTVSATGDVTGAGVSLSQHTHTGDSGGSTSAPN